CTITCPLLPSLLRCPPTSTLCPYTTLFRSTERFNAAFPGILLQSKSPDLHTHCRWEIIKACWDEYAVTQICAPFGQRPTDGYERSEEHTSELQSRESLVCRLLLEKKKQEQEQHNTYNTHQATTHRNTSQNDHTDTRTEKNTRAHVR